MNSSNHSHTLARELVHKGAISEVLVTSITGQRTSWICHAQLPRRHHFHTDTIGTQRAYHDPLLVLEAFRQACIAASHLFYDVPMDARHTVRYYELSVVDIAALARGPKALDLEIGIVVRKEFRRGEDGPVQGLDVAAVASRDGTKVVEMSGGFGWMSASRWASFRAGASWDPGPQPASADPARVGRTCPENVVIGDPVVGADRASAPILVDLDHPAIFDHPLDHLPGGLIIEACRQLSLAVMGPAAVTVTVPDWLRCDYQSFTELDATSAAVVTQAADESLSFRGSVTQSGQTRATVDLTFAAE